eukprot:1474611-Amphidinium_carterae.1
MFVFGGSLFCLGFALSEAGVVTRSLAMRAMDTVGMQMVATFIAAAKGSTIQLHTAAPISPTLDSAPSSRTRTA